MRLQEPLGPPLLAVSKVGPAAALVNSPFTFVVTAGLVAGSPPAATLTLTEQLDSGQAAFVQPMPDPSELKDNQLVAAISVFRRHAACV